MLLLLLPSILVAPWSGLIYKDRPISARIKIIQAYRTFDRLPFLLVHLDATLLLSPSLYVSLQWPIRIVKKRLLRPKKPTWYIHFAHSLTSSWDPIGYHREL
ncbi:uncharacterized protein BO72DRAFT_481006 [Aspergillus fijiensis CBS 313.89]|uniref:Uncharacterized protein n=1 Tax=Aspergillus fijiensis CBS 313.89 TaxID=1448319 RepID=A0A8G1RJ60_9EURO|nr:uncharacterized protein BO72DRAFT_481006 [Aspergillus fijiensis CBS 313.89]RAK72416.1 hypothetical protein BO72DRAFT_481006 [Aspergillus fijiensis CBS 313.89]